MRTVFLGAYGYGNLGDELCLLEAIGAFPSSEVLVSTVDEAHTRRSVDLTRGFFGEAAFLRLKPERVVYGGGGIGNLPGLALHLRWMLKAQAWGARTHIHNIAVANLPPGDWLDDEVRQALLGLTSISVRDHKSVEYVHSWNLGLSPRLTHFPERLVEPDFTIADAMLPGGRPLMGLSIINSPLMIDVLERNGERIRRLLALFPDHAVVPVVSQWHRNTNSGNDAHGFEIFERMFLRPERVVFREMLDRDWWYENLTSRTLKGIIARLGVLVSQRKHNCIHGIGAGVPTIGLHPVRDDSLNRTFLSCGHALARGSHLVSLV